jgi:tetratricopeptide (TPR) repeat protein
MRKKDEPMDPEHCRIRLQSIEMLLASAPQDALVLARALVDDVLTLRPAGALSDEARQSLAVARQWVDQPESTPAAAARGIVALRHLVADAARPTDGTAPTGLAVVRAAVRRATWVHAAIAVAVVLAIVIAAMQTRGGQERRAAAFESAFADGTARLGAGDHAGAIERFRTAISAVPDTDRTADAWNNMGWSLQQLGRHREAIEAYRKALQLRPAYPLARNNLDAAQRQLDLTKAGTMAPPSAPAK